MRLGDLFAQTHDVAAKILTLAGVGHVHAQRLEVDVLRGVVVRAKAHRLDRDLELLDLRDDDDLDVRIVLLRDLEDLEAADAGQVRVEDHEVDVFLLHHLESALAGGGAKDAKIAAQESGERLAHRLVVVDDEQGLAAV